MATPHIRADQAARRDLAGRLYWTMIVSSGVFVIGYGPLPERAHRRELHAFCRERFQQVNHVPGALLVAVEPAIVMGGSRMTGIRLPHREGEAELTGWTDLPKLRQRIRS